MTKSEHNRRRVEFYLGQKGDMRLKKDQLAEFIMSDMGLVRSDDGPKWTDGLIELIELGMNAYELRRDGRPIGGNAEYIEKLEQRVGAYRQKIEDLRSERDLTRCDLDLSQPSDQVHRIEARILEVLCREENIGTDSPNFVDILEVVKETGFNYDTIVHYGNVLSKSEFGGYVIFEDHEEAIRAVRPEAFDQYTSEVGLEPSGIRKEV